MDPFDIVRLIDNPKTLGFKYKNQIAYIRLLKKNQFKRTKIETVYENEKDIKIIFGETSDNKYNVSTKYNNVLDFDDNTIILENDLNHYESLMYKYPKVSMYEYPNIITYWRTKIIDSQFKIKENKI